MSVYEITMLLTISHQHRRRVPGLVGGIRVQYGGGKWGKVGGAVKAIHLFGKRVWKSPITKHAIKAGKDAAIDMGKNMLRDAAGGQFKENYKTRLKEGAKKFGINLIKEIPGIISDYATGQSGGGRKRENTCCGTKIKGSPPPKHKKCKKVHAKKPASKARHKVKKQPTVSKPRKAAFSPLQDIFQD